MTQHRLWYISLFIEAALLSILVWRRSCPMFALWLAFDVVTGLLNVWVDYSHATRYQIAWGLKQPPALALRFLAAREIWNQLGGCIWSRVCVGLAAFACIAQARGWPHSVIEVEFCVIAIANAALALILWLSLRAAWRLTTDPFVVNLGYVMCGYFILTAICYYAAWGYREDIGRATGVVAILGYGASIAVVMKHRRRHGLR